MSSLDNWKKAGIVAAGAGLLILLGWLSDSGDAAAQPVQAQKKGKRAPNKGQNAEALAEKAHLLIKQAERAKQMEDFDKAEAFYLEAASLLESDPESEVYAGYIVYAAGLVGKAQKNYDKAEKHILRAISLIEKHVTPEDKLIEHFADALATLAEVYSIQERYEESEELLMGAIKQIDMRAAFVFNKPASSQEEGANKAKAVKEIKVEQVILLDNLCKLRMKQNKFEDAEIIAKQAAFMCVQSFGLKDPSTIRSLIALGDVFAQQGKAEECESIYEALLKEEEFTYFNPDTGYLVHIMARYSFNNGNYEKAETLYRKAKALMELNHEEDEEEENLKIISYLTNDLASSLKEQHKDEEADELINQVKEMLKKFQSSPPLTSSKYLESLSASIQLAINENSIEPHMTIALTVKEHKNPANNNNLPAGSLLECHFENLEGEPFIKEHILQPNEKTITISSPHLTKAEKGYFLIKIFIYADESKENKLGEHNQLCQSVIDSAGLEELVGKLSKPTGLDLE